MRCLYDGEHPCGKCPACLANRQRAFMFRLDQEKEDCKFYYWLTLQYDDDHVPKMVSSQPVKSTDSKTGREIVTYGPERLEMCFSKEHCHNFFEKLRKRYKKHGFTFKHFLVSEYGPNFTQRPHYHCLLMVYSEHDLRKNLEARKEMRDFILNEAWPYGHVTEKTFHGRVLRYLTKYCLKPELLGQYHTMKPFTLISKGIGASFLDKIPKLQKQQMIDTLDFTYRYGNSTIQLPRYYVDKMLPHSAQNLRDLMPVDNLQDPDSWLDYKRMVSLRRRLQDKQYALGKEYAVKKTWSKTPYQKLKEVSYQLSEFRAKCKTRKDL